jgi:hypothetical protein
MKLHEVDLVTEARAAVNVAVEDKDFRELRKDISSRKKEVLAHFNKQKKIFIKATAELVVAEIGWDVEFEALIQLFQDDGRGKALDNAFKKFSKEAAQAAIDQFRDDPDIFDDMIAEDLFNGMVREMKKVKL